MGCCSPYDPYKDEDVKGYCPDCGTPVDEDGDALEGCTYSPVDCKTCGWQPCDLSC